MKFYMFNMILISFMMIISTFHGKTQTPLHNQYNIVNKSACKMDIKVGCTSGIIYPHFLTDGDYVIGDCGTGYAICFISVDFHDGIPGPELVKLDPLTAFYYGPCLSPPAIDTTSSPCYQGTFTWNNHPNGYRVVSIQ